MPTRARAPSPGRRPGPRSARASASGRRARLVPARRIRRRCVSFPPLSRLRAPADACLRPRATRSRARMSSASFMLRLTPRAAVVARPIVPAPTTLRPNSAPRIVAPTETVVWSFCCDAWADSRSTDAFARRRCSASCACFDAYFFRRASTAASRVARAASCTRTLKSRSVSPGRDVSLRSFRLINSSFSA